MTREELDNILKEMDLPEKRLDLSREENISWLLRNLAIRNREHPKIKEVLIELVGFARGSINLR